MTTYPHVDDLTFDQIYKLHRQRVYSVCLRMLQNVEDAEDLSQDVFIVLHKKLDLFRGDSAFTTWLHRVTVNQVLMYMRQRKIKLWNGESLDDIGEFESAGSNHVKWFNDCIALEDALRQLPNGYRRTLELHDVDGFEHEEVARIMGVTVGTSKSQLSKARVKMRRLLKRKANPRVTPTAIDSLPGAPLAQVPTAKP